MSPTNICFILSWYDKLSKSKWIRGIFCKETVVLLQHLAISSTNDALHISKQSQKETSKCLKTFVSIVEETSSVWVVSRAHGAYFISPRDVGQLNNDFPTGLRKAKQVTYVYEHSPTNGNSFPRLSPRFVTSLYCGCAGFTSFDSKRSANSSPMAAAIAAM